MIKSNDVVQVARSYLGVRFKLHGRDRNGLDCVGLFYRVLTDLGMIFEDDINYGRGPEVEKLQAVLDLHTRVVRSHRPQNGQIVKIRQFIFPMHLGLIALERGQATLIHANVKKSKVVEQPYADWFDMVVEHRAINGVR